MRVQNSIEYNCPREHIVKILVCALKYLEKNLAVSKYFSMITLVAIGAGVLLAGGGGGEIQFVPRSLQY